MKETINDFDIENHGSLFFVRPLTRKGKKFLKETAPEDAQFMGSAMAVEPRYIQGVLDAIVEAGLTYR